MSTEFSFIVSWNIIEEDEIDLSDEVTVHVTVEPDDMPEGWSANDVHLLIDMGLLFSSDGSVWDSAGDERSDKIGLLQEAGDPEDEGFQAKTFQALHVDEYLDAFTIAASGTTLKYKMGNLADSNASITKPFVLATGRSLNKAPAIRGYYSFRCSVEYVPVPPPVVKADGGLWEFEIAGH